MSFRSLTAITFVSSLLFIGGVFALPPRADASTIIQRPLYIGLTNGLIGSWSFDGQDMNATKALDRSGQGNNGTLTNGPTRTAGKIGQALSFDGVDDRVSLGNPASLQITGSLSIAAWIKADAFPNGDDNHILSKSGSSGSVGYKFSATIDNGVEQVYMVVSGDGTNFAQRYTATTITTGRWYHVVGVYNAAAQTIDVYVDGTLNNGILSGTVPSSVFNTSDPAYIGVYNGSFARLFDGLIDDVRIYNRALSPEEIHRLYKIGGTFGVNRTNNSDPAFTNGLIGHWTFDGTDVSGSKVYDVSGNGKHGTMNNF